VAPAYHHPFDGICLGPLLCRMACTCWVGSGCCGAYVEQRTWGGGKAVVGQGTWSSACGCAAA
jgi:hypothetical protein